MQSKLQELTEKIYQEGVSKANEEAENILAQARHQAEDLLKQAQKQAEDLVKDAERKSAELHHNTMSEIRLSARQAMTEIKQQIMGMIEKKALDAKVKEAMNDAGFTRELISTAIKNWNPKADEAIALEVLLPKEKEAEFQAWFKAQANELLQQGLEIQFTDRVKAGFKIGPKDGGYFISFTDQDFESLFKSYLRPKLVEMLFGKE